MGMLQMTWQPSLLKSLNRKHGAPPLGLRNLGNSCYLNSVLQCLTYTPPLANFCIRYLHSSSCDLGVSKEKKGECPFCLLEKRIARSLSSDAASDAPLKINSCLRIYAEHFRAGRQEDAHEFLRYVIDACHNTCLRLKKLQQQQLLRGKTGIANGKDVGGTGETVVKEIFGGALQSQVKCLSCGAQSNKIDEIMDLSLDILHSGSLKHALQKFFQAEILDGNNKYKCDHCKELVAARKQMTILQAPNVLVIQLKRFEGVFGGKVDKPIAFEEMLVLSSYICEESQDLHPEYNLFGTIVHSGFSPDSGHYYAYIKDATGHWYCCNDSYVTVSNLQEVLSEKAYLLFFSRTKLRPQTKYDLVVNGSKSHVLNGKKKPIMPKSGYVEKSVSTKQALNNKLEINNWAKSYTSNGTTAALKTGHLEKPVNQKIYENHSELNNTTNDHAPDGITAVTVQRADHVAASVSMNGPSDNHTKMNTTAASPDLNCSNSNWMPTAGGLAQPVVMTESSDQHSRTNGSTKSKVEQGLSSQQIKFSLSGSTTKFLGSSEVKIANSKKVSGDENGYTATSVTSSETEKIEFPINEGNGTREKPADGQIPKIGLVSLDNGHNKHAAVDSLESATVVATKIMITSKPLGLEQLQNGDVPCSSSNEGRKRRMQADHPCVLLARDDQSRMKVETFKELIGKEASTILRSCGWCDEVQNYMRARKKLCHGEGTSALNGHESKSLLISHAKRDLISKVPKSLKATLIERLRTFSLENK